MSAPFAATPREPSRRELLALDIDMRLLELWRELGELDLDPRLLQPVADAVRAAYGLGYYDALVEPVRASLWREHGYPVPPAPERASGEPPTRASGSASRR